jgi:hypothetical protein
MTGDILLALVILDVVAGGSAIWRLITREWPWYTVKMAWRWATWRCAICKRKHIPIRKARDGKTFCEDCSSAFQLR